MTLTTSPPCCPRCGFNLPLAPSSNDTTQSALLEAQNTIADLQAQVRLLNQKASAAVDRWADYEDELAALRASVAAPPQTPPRSLASPTTTTTPRTTTTTTTSASSFLPAAAATRLSAFLSPRKTAPAPLAAMAMALKPHPTARSGSAPTPLLSPSPALTSPTPSTATTEDLLEALSREQALRLDAENRLSETSREVEDLSVTLFEQANEMVATERRARAALEERVETLERREGEKKRRLARLEGAMERIERVRRLLGTQAGGGGETVFEGRGEKGGEEGGKGLKAES
ncbi:hypothetical protein B0T19DRAFT_475051 [Cercophora scortea]|uniref:GDP/GTP exchange factor Sec2 N-terminal domain-containing protein n=1 Tax=Cercophora scortea TaxID=314031 RepID=A0AAE0IMQ1_9PEZI|nr:hypothetical protein B0T19DRAFT_475051 [Cercophora scortea]